MPKTLYPTDGDVRTVEREASPEMVAVLDADRRFFADNPWRRYRVRPATSAEMDDAVAAGTGVQAAPPGWAWFFAIRKLSGEARARVALLAPASCLDLPEPAEDLALFLYDRAVMPNPTGRAWHDRISATFAKPAGGVH